MALRFSRSADRASALTVVLPDRQSGRQHQEERQLSNDLDAFLAGQAPGQSRLERHGPLLRRSATIWADLANLVPMGHLAAPGWRKDHPWSFAEIRAPGAADAGHTKQPSRLLVVPTTSRRRCWRRTST